MDAYVSHSTRLTMQFDTGGHTLTFNFKTEMAALNEFERFSTAKREKPEEDFTIADDYGCRAALVPSKVICATITEIAQLAKFNAELQFLQAHAQVTHDERIMADGRLKAHALKIMAMQARAQGQHPIIQ